MTPCDVRRARWMATVSFVSWLKFQWNLFIGAKLKTRCVDGTPTSDVALFTIWYIHPPHHGHKKVTVMVINDQLALISFRVNRPSYSWDKAISNYDLENQGQGHGCAVSSWFTSFLLHISETNNSWDRAISKFDLLIQGQGYGWGQRSRSLNWPSTQPMHSIFVSHQLNKPFLGYGQKCLTLKNTSEIWKKKKKKKMPENSLLQNSSKM